MITLVLFAALTLPPQQNSTSPDTDAPVVPEKVLAWQLEGLTQDEMREEVDRRGLTDCAEQPLLDALSATRADVETVLAVKHAKAPCKLWKLGLRLPRPTDYLYEVAGAILWNDWGHALGVMQIEASKQPKDPDVHLIYAHFLRMSGDWILAYGEAKRAVEMAPGSPYTHAELSTICYRSRLPECATHEAMVFLKLRPEDASAYIILGHARELQGHDDEALEAYTEAKLLHPGYSETFAGFGRVYGRQGELEKATTAFEQAIKLERGDAPEYSCELAQLYLAEGYPRKAIETLQEAKQINPDRLDILMTLGDAYLVGEQYPAAIRQYKDVLEVAPELEIARVRLAKALRADGREAEAAQLYAEPLGKQAAAKPK